MWQHVRCLVTETLTVIFLPKGFRRLNRSCVGDAYIYLGRSSSVAFSTSVSRAVPHINLNNIAISMKISTGMKMMTCLVYISMQGQADCTEQGQ
jgi:hypothetical protein